MTKACKIFHFALSGNLTGNRTVKKKPRAAENSTARPADRNAARDEQLGPSEVRIIGGKLGGRKIAYSGDVRTRPMKDRTRESIFNLLTDRIVGFCAIDLFAGTGALGIEAISRGAARAVFCEKHFPTADLIRRNAKDLAIADQVEVLACDSFLNMRRMKRDGQTFDAGRPWVVFLSPPYAFYVDRREEMLTLINDVFELAPSGSMLVVEADGKFDVSALPDAESWRIREYYPAVVGLYRKESSGV